MWPRDRKKPRIPASYILAVQRAGARPCVLSAFELGPGEKVPPGLDVTTEIEPDDAQLPEDTTGLVLTGGGDVDPALYGQKQHPRTYNVNRRRDEFEMNLLKQALEKDLPVLAICRGMQLLNVQLGGNLDQHIADLPGRLDHDRDRPRGEVAHDVRIDDGNGLADVLGTRLGVNSHHHQGLDGPADGLTEIGWADDGVLEAVVAPDYYWVYGVQWHPESMAPLDERQMALFIAFADAARAATSEARKAKARSA